MSITPQAINTGNYCYCDMWVNTNISKDTITKTSTQERQHVTVLVQNKKAQLTLTNPRDAKQGVYKFN